MFKDIADARVAAAGGEDAGGKDRGGEPADVSALGRLLAIVENYPQLKANEQFNRLMDELSGTENRLAVERMRYNEAVQAVQHLAPAVPANLTAKMFGFKEYPFFEAPAGREAGAEGQLQQARNRRAAAVGAALVERPPGSARAARCER